jgi:two-component system phosphate regulon sensor histidine kinase PhoR
VNVAGSKKGDFLEIRVSDTGYGIASDQLPLIFERFYRVKTDKTRYIVGTGLGLPIVKSIVEAHNGTVRVESKEGAGSTFSVRLPLERL